MTYYFLYWQTVFFSWGKSRTIHWLCPFCHNSQVFLLVYCDRLYQKLFWDQHFFWLVVSVYFLGHIYCVQNADIFSRIHFFWGHSFIMIKQSKSVFWLLRYYATFKARKFGSLFYKINACFQKTTTCIGLQAEQKFSVYFSILGMAFAVPLLGYFQKLQLLLVKKFWTDFCCIVLVLLYLWAQKVYLRFLKSFFFFYFF